MQERKDFRIMIVDDEEDFTEVTKLILRRSGYRVLSFNDPRAALAVFAWAPDRFDAVIVDEIMPSMRGTELTRELLKIKDDLPVILATGHGDIIPVEEVRASGVRETLTKPVFREQLLSVLEKLLK